MGALALLVVFAVACGSKKGQSVADGGAGGSGGAWQPSDGRVTEPEPDGGATADGPATGHGGTAGADGGENVGDADGASDATGTDASRDAGVDSSDAPGATFACHGSHADAASNGQCVRGVEYCDDGACYDLAKVGCAQKPTCLCVDHGYVNCHCSDDGRGAVTHLGCDPI